MPRPRKSVRKIGSDSAEEVRHGLNLIRNGSLYEDSIYHNKTKTYVSLENQRLEPNYSVKQIFTSDQETSLK
nr:unnamed protein product [Callosobruchus analis]